MILRCSSLLFSLHISTLAALVGCSNDAGFLGKTPFAGFGVASDKEKTGGEKASGDSVNGSGSSSDLSRERLSGEDGGIVTDDNGAEIGIVLPKDTTGYRLLSVGCSSDAFSFQEPTLAGTLNCSFLPSNDYKHGSSFGMDDRIVEVKKVRIKYCDTYSARSEKSDEEKRNKNGKQIKEPHRGKAYGYCESGSALTTLHIHKVSFDIESQKASFELPREVLAEKIKSFEMDAKKITLKKCEMKEKKVKFRKLIMSEQGETGLEVLEAFYSSRFLDQPESSTYSLGASYQLKRGDKDEYDEEDKEEDGKIAGWFIQELFRLLFPTKSDDCDEFDD